MTTINLAPCVDSWKRQLLDTSGRNRALYYRRVQSTVELKRPEHVVWETLNSRSSIELTARWLVDPNLSGEESAKQLAEAQRRIKRLAEAQRSYLEEQGVHVLHLVMGWLTWPDVARAPLPRDESVVLADGRKAVLVRSPLLFVPVKFDKGRTPTELSLAPDDDLEINVALLHILKSEYGATPDIDIDGELTPEEVLKAFRTLADERQNWSVSTEQNTLLDVFSFKKIALYRELERSEERVAAQPLLRALCGDSSLLESTGDLPSMERLDHALSAAALTLPVPADASQIRAILAAKSGRSLVIQGPPGTGKSQTITNLISTLVTDGKRVLFVAEKRAAREIVVRNLHETGLQDILLHLTEAVSGARGGSQAKGEILEQLSTLLEKGPLTYQVPSEAARTLERQRSELNNYVEELHQPLNSAAWSSPFSLMSQYTRTQTTQNPPALPGIPPIAQVDSTWLDDLLDLAEELDALGPAAREALRGPWGDATLTSLTMRQSEELRTTLSVLMDAPSRVATIAAANQLSKVVSLSTCAQVQEAAPLLQDLGRFHLLKRKGYHWFLPQYWSLRGRASQFVSSGGLLTGEEEKTGMQLAEFVHSLNQALESLHSVLPEFKEQEDLEVQANAAQELFSNLNQLREVAAVRAVLANTTDEQIAPLLVSTLLLCPPDEPIAPVLERPILAYWLDEVLAARPALNTNAVTQDRRRQRFLNADSDFQRYGKLTCLNQVAKQRPSLANITNPGSALGYLRRAINMRRRPALRRIFAESATAIQALTPCIIASPLSVAQFLHDDNYSFDTVIFDEASQIPVGDAVVPISRASQVIVVGDVQQMPPTSFFDKAASTESASDLDEGSEDFESILQQCDSVLPTTDLLWHYRSRDERLIAFSNISFYNGRLWTFPSSWEHHPDQGVAFVHVDNAVYGRGGSRSNPQEAEEVVKLLSKELANHPEQDVAVTAMSETQRGEIQARIESASSLDEVLQQWLEGGGRVKNLETIQGDECDVMILSFGYGKDAAGNVQANFGPLSKANGYRRLNVAVTRARRKNIVVASIRASDIPVTVGSGGGRVRSYLDYAEHGVTALLGAPNVSELSVYDSPFEEDVAQQLRGLGWQVDTQIGVSRYRIDLGVRDQAAPGRYLAGIECDGATYHSAETARDRDIGRQAVLERLGWKILRVWSPEWFRDREGVLLRLQKDLEQAAIDTSGLETRPEVSVRQNIEQITLPLNLDVHASPLTQAPVETIVYNIPTSYPDLRGEALEERVIRLVREHGPLHRDELRQALRIQLEYGKLGSNIRARFDLFMAHVALRHQIEWRNDWAWPPNMPVEEVPVRRNETEPKRKFEWYCDEELIAALKSIPAEMRVQSDEGLAEQIADLLGYNRVSEAMRKRLISVIRASNPS